MHTDELLKKIHKRVERRAKINLKIKQPISSKVMCQHNHKPWYQGDDFSPEEAEKLELTSQPLFMEDVPAATEVSLDNKLKKDSSHQNSHFKEDNFMNNDIKKDETQPSTLQAQIVHNSGTDGTQLKTNLVQSGSKLDPKWIQTRSKVDPILRQNRDNTETQAETNLVQTEYKRSTNLVQTEYKPSTNLVQTEYKPSAQPSTTFKTEYKPSTTFSSLVGLQRKLVKFVYDECKIARAKTTKQLSIEYIVKTLETPYFSIKATIQRLIKKGVVIRTNLKQGRGGWVTYGVPDLVFNEILRYEETEYKPSTNLVHCSSFEQKPSAQPSTSLSSSSSNNNKDTTTNGNELPEEWRNINLDPLQDIGFSEKHLRQIFNLNLPDVVEESIKHFAFGLLNNPNAKQYTNPINVIMGVLRKGQAWVENNYKSPQEIAQQELASRKKAEAERLAKLAQEIYDAEFKIWENGLSAEEIKAIEFGTKYCGPLKSRLKACFNETAWATKQNKP